MLRFRWRFRQRRRLGGQGGGLGRDRRGQLRVDGRGSNQDGGVGRRRLTERDTLDHHLALLGRRIDLRRGRWGFVGRWLGRPQRRGFGRIREDCRFVEEGRGDDESQEGLRMPAAKAERYDHPDAFIVVHVDVEALAQGRVQVGALAEGVVHGRVDHELAVDPRHMDEHVAVLVGDHAPGIAGVRCAEHRLDPRAALRREPVGQFLEASPFCSGPVAAGAHTGDEGNDVTHGGGKSPGSRRQAVARPCAASASNSSLKSSGS